MILHHVAHGAGSVVVFSPVSHAEGFGSPYFHPVDVVPVPQRLEDSVRKTQYQNVLDGFLPQIVVDPVYLALGEYSSEQSVQSARRLQIAAERFFDDDPAPSAFPFRYIQSAFEKTLRDHRIHGGRRGQIVEYPIRQTQFPPEPDDTLRKLWVGPRIGRIETQVIDFPEKFVRRGRPSIPDGATVGTRCRKNRFARHPESRSGPAAALARKARKRPAAAYGRSNRPKHRK